MEFDQVLNESFKRYHLRYEGTRPDYTIHDKRPYVLAIDDDYNVDGNGKSILGINLNYYMGDIHGLVDEINDADNKAGFRGIEGRIKLRKHLTRDASQFENWVSNRRKMRYMNLIENFPYLGKFIRRYKISGAGGTGVLNKQRVLLK